jgi:hypothetical protein
VKTKSERLKYILSVEARNPEYLVYALEQSIKNIKKKYYDVNIGTDKSKVRYITKVTNRDYKDTERWLQMVT